jgi:hypothetical protein
MFIYAAPVNRTRGSAYKCVGMLTKLWADCVPKGKEGCDNYERCERNGIKLDDGENTRDSFVASRESMKHR